MDIKAGIGVSAKLDSSVAAREAARIALHQLGGRDVDIVIIFISPIFEQQAVIRAVRSITGYAPLIGCSSAGTITNLGVFRNSIAVCILSSDSCKFSCAIGRNVIKNSRLAGSEAAKLSSNIINVTKQLYIMFSDCLLGNTADILRGAQEIRGTSFPIIGGSATDDLRFQKSYQYLKDSIYTDSVVGLLMGGNIKIGTGTAHGWQPIGKPHSITKAKVNIIKQIDGNRAYELYEQYLDKSYNELITGGIARLGCSYPIGMRLDEKKEFLIRIPLKIDDNGSIILNAEIPEHKNINLMIGDKRSLLEATKKACTQALTGIRKSSIKFAFVFSDIGRLQLLRNDSQQEVNIIKQMIGKDIPFFGCYTCGMYAPIDFLKYHGRSYIHSQTISITLFSE
jgi:hypothetical protein